MDAPRTPEGMSLSHFTRKPLGPIHSTEQKPRYERWSCHDKPRGLWVSVDGADDWPSWCESADFGIGSRRYRVELYGLERILMLKTSDELIGFTDKYGKNSGRYSFRDVAICWSAVAEEYAGIIITPYCWDLRLDDRTDWYYGWDCASGCIWDASVVASVYEYATEAAA